MQVIDVRDRQPDRHADRPVQEILDDGAVSAYRVACVHEARAVVEVVLGQSDRRLHADDAVAHFLAALRADAISSSGPSPLAPSSSSSAS